MLCKNPYMMERHAFPCGQCMPCRIAKKREWMHRIMLEAKLHADNAFVTLTYNDDHVPRDGSLVPRDLQLWLKVFRKKLLPNTVRYFAVGEYGDVNERPHYHIALFGYPPCARGRTALNRAGKCCTVCDLLSDTWNKGRVFVGSLEPESAGYIAGYVTKKMTSMDDERLRGRHPEFARMSRRPGLGVGYMDEVASTIMEHGLETQEDVPTVLRHGSRLLPIGRSLRRKLRERIGRDPSTPPTVMAKMEAELSELRKKAYEDAPKYQKRDAFRNAIVEANDGRRVRNEARARIFKTKRHL